ncbi:hypothetical protein ZHAS_00016466 [Anopheles sinensis]|uniref:Uncharacterized protein n=1 Tax=Anopheles sinensis TaxID=74873 RepID=A0A084WE36_ANOSI|nr:hypothetical protein ZHAS_00016466 [Anopheles sinensis]
MNPDARHPDSRVRHSRWWNAPSSEPDWSDFEIAERSTVGSMPMSLYAPARKHFFECKTIGRQNR